MTDFGQPVLGCLKPVIGAGARGRAAPEEAPP